MPIKITDSIYNVGVLNPIMRVFDIVMRTEYGTSYNSYIVKGSNKTALIDTSHLTFEDEYINKIKEVTAFEDIDYIIINHFEPDHSGALAKILELAPNAELLCSQAGSIYLKNIVNRDDINIRTVKNGDFIDLGDKKLNFIIAPFLHWPDTMFTYCEEEKALFSCDFLGAHYCEPTMIDTSIAYPERYKEAFEEYYIAIMKPFKKYVLAGLDKIKDLDIEFACTSHGPVLTKGCMLERNMYKYLQWSQPDSKKEKLIPIFYASAYGNTKLAAEEIAKGVRDTMTKAKIEAFVPLVPIVCDEIDMDLVDEYIEKADAFCIGSSTINKAPGPVVWQILAKVDVINSRNKVAGVFGSYGWSGEAIGQMVSFLKSYQFNVVGDGYKFRFVPNKEELEGAYQYGIDFATEAFIKTK